MGRTLSHDVCLSGGVWIGWLTNTFPSLATNYWIKLKLLNSGPGPAQLSLNSPSFTWHPSIHVPFCHSPAQLPINQSRSNLAHIIPSANKLNLISIVFHDSSCSWKFHLHVFHDNFHQLSAAVISSPQLLTADKMNNQSRELKHDTHIVLWVLMKIPLKLFLSTNFISCQQL